MSSAMGRRKTHRRLKRAVARRAPGFRGVLADLRHAHARPSRFSIAGSNSPVPELDVLPRPCHCVCGGAVPRRGALLFGREGAEA
jgi:hypothetical protein